MSYLTAELAENTQITAPQMRSDFHLQNINIFLFFPMLFGWKKGKRGIRVHLGRKQARKGSLEGGERMQK